MLPLNVSNYLIIVDGISNFLSPCIIFQVELNSKADKSESFARIREHGRLPPFPADAPDEGATKE